MWKARRATDGNNQIKYGACPLHAGWLRQQYPHIYNILLFHGNNFYANGLRYYHITCHVFICHFVPKSHIVIFVPFVFIKRIIFENLKNGWDWVQKYLLSLETFKDRSESFAKRWFYCSLFVRHKFYFSQTTILVTLVVVFLLPSVPIHHVISCHILQLPRAQ